ncbi:glycoside hydrolase family 31 protein [Acidipila sp. 4G-K13]|uniref:Glycoside hydrolase family 31 protein n=2 Tax=Paracidobacterium acidisoli TaxID=2303751 RepID=A0A372IJL8_9BACT|nr:glycoside hydrolase family 31 protein [Paracidobacterium acidisoli]
MPLGILVCSLALPALASHVSADNGGREANGQPIAAQVQRETDALAFTVPGFKPGRNSDGDAKLLLQDVSFDGAAVSTGSLHVRELSDGVQEITGEAPKVGVWKFAVNDAADGYYALGERFNSLNHAHQILVNSSQDNPAAKGTDTYKPIPFYMSTTGYGLWLDTTAEATFDLNVTSREDVWVSVPGKKLRIVFIAGPAFPKILDRFTALAGRSILPPYWSFAPWVSRDYYPSDAEVEKDIQKTRDLGLPASVVLIDSPWATGYNSYIFNPKQFSDVPEMIRNIHEKGYKLVLWHTSWINNRTKTPGEVGFADKIDVESSNYKEAAAKGYFVKDASGKPYAATWWKGQGSMIDFTNPEAKAWWQAQLENVVAQGADGFKDDDAEGNFQGSARFADGTDPRLMRNKYTVLYNNAVEEVLQKKLHGNGILLIRSATVGDHNLAFLWGGDNEASFSTENGLPTVVTAGLGAGLSGMPLWLADLGGYLKTASTPDPRLFMRWTEYSAFSPVMETISTANLDPWDYGAEALGNYRKYAVLHMSLFPYLYAATQEASRTGMPIMRALVLEYQNDQRAREAKDEYLFGPDFLVAPVIDENTSRVVYLPPGEWVNYWTGEALQGGKIVIADAPLETLPLYARASAIIPKIPEDVMTLVPGDQSGNTSIKSLDDRRVYELLPEAADSGSVGITDFEGRNLTRSAHSLTIQGKPADVTVRWRFGKVHSVSVNGSEITVQNGADGPYVEFRHKDHTTIAWN